MNLGPLLVPFVLFAAVVLLLASACFEGHGAPRKQHAQLLALDGVETALSDGPAYIWPRGIDEVLIREPRRSAA